MQVNTDKTVKEQTKSSAMELNEPQPSDDDDFPDEQEIFQANGLLKLPRTISAPVSKTKSITKIFTYSLETNEYSSAISGSDTFISTCNSRSYCTFRHDSSTGSTKWLSIQWTRD